MAYATTADLTARFGEEEMLALAPNETIDAIEESKVDVAINDAGATIDSYLAVRYTVPVIDAPQLKAVACDIARYNLYDNEAPEQVEKRHKERLAWLKDISIGKATLGVQEATTTAKAVNVIVTRRKRDRLFTRRTMRSF
jgi:phage gp36-like protein